MSCLQILRCSNKQSFKRAEFSQAEAAPGASRSSHLSLSPKNHRIIMVGKELYDPEARFQPIPPCSLTTSYSAAPPRL